MNLFESMGMELFEADKKEIKATLNQALVDAGFTKKGAGGRLKPDLRFDISGKNEFTLTTLRDILNSKGMEQSDGWEIQTIGPNDGDDAKSGTYFTYWIKGEGVRVSIVDSMKDDSRVGRKEFAPNKFLRTEYEYKSMELYNEVKDKLNGMQKLPDEIREYMIYLMDQIKKTTTHEDELPQSGKFSVKKAKHNFEITKAEQANIFNDFGEVLSAFYLGRLTTDPILFPAGSNNPIADFYIGDTPISAKNKSGAKAAITGILSDETLYEELIEELGDKAEILKIIKGSTVLHSFLKLAKHYNTKSWNALVKRIGEINLVSGQKSLQKKRDKEIKQQMYDWLDDIYSRNDDGEYTGDKQALFDAVREYAGEIGIGRTMALETKYRPNSDKRYGVFIYPLYSEITKALQADTVLVQKINKIINNMSAKQIHIYDKPDSMEFKLNAFKDAKFKFEMGNISAWNPTNSNITFKVG